MTDRGVTDSATTSLATPTRNDGRLALALDIGGTKVAAGVVDGGGAVLGRARRRMPTERGADDLFAAVLDCLNAALADSGVPVSALAGLGCGCGGPMTWPAGEVSPLNITAWRGFPLRERLRAAFPGLPVLVHNDAVALAAGEHWKGTAQGVRNMLAVTVSTGVGGGLVLDGRLFHGRSGNAGHIGHMIVEPEGTPCVCGARGCLEAVASGPSSVRWALEQGWQPPAGTAADGVALATAAADGDPVARRALARSGRAVGLAVASCASLLDLDVVVVAGGFAQAGPLFWDALQETVDRERGMEFARRTEVRPSVAPADVPLQGAASFILVPESYSWEG